MKKQVVKNKNALGLKLWVKLLGYKVKDLAAFKAPAFDTPRFFQLVSVCGDSSMRLAITS